jgi:hypothetical protein
MALNTQPCCYVKTVTTLDCSVVHGLSSKSRAVPPRLQKKPAVALKMGYTLQSKMHACYNLARWDSTCTEMWPFRAAGL